MDSCFCSVRIGRGVQRRRRPLIAVPVDHEPARVSASPGLGARCGARSPRRRARRGRRRRSSPSRPRQIHDRQHPLDLAVEVADDEEALRLSVQPARGDRGRPLALPGPNQLEDRARGPRAGRVPGSTRPRNPTPPATSRCAPVRNRNFRSKIARCCARPVVAPRRPGCARGPPEDALVAVEVTPSQVGVEHVASQVVRRHAIRPVLDEGQFPQPCEHVVYVALEHGVPQQRLGGHARESACLEGTTALIGRDQIDEPSQQRGDEVGVSGSTWTSPPPAATSASKDSPSG